MDKFHFSLPITVNYGDIDAQWHVNNKMFLSYIETARFQYLLKLKLFDARSFLEVPFIVADVHVRYLAPIEFADPVVVSVGITHIGTKSVKMEYAITSPDGNVVYATAENVLVAYDYHTKTSVAVSAEMRRKISEFEGRSFEK
ncbi:MAG: acyl-CoA thioesterase [Anaerolineaceae bacterium]|nr:acyl-CoA thioesterase [Anaerolineaceae bacterium]